MADIIVIGAGIIGSACAWRLAGAGLEVVVFDPAEPGSQASQAALGVLSFHARAENPPELHELASASRQFYPAILEELAGATGERVAYNQTGHLGAALSDDDEQELQDAVALNQRHRFAFERVDSAACQKLEPTLNPEVRSGLLFLEDACVDNQALTQAIVRAAQAEGVDFRRAAVEAIEARAGRVQGVRAGAEFHGAEWVILAAGCWSG
ncbi:MAG: NAD(P)/FAD-dependent oxidoreductase, partial [Anaerolineales bacterium]